ncbi:hypothetical protein AB0D27_45415, partial [Streptomyces sp. NPDC048415]|uniref:hypothetical protein n=1 Tax=Streptomyces sp. NPDC048415 TaxID=3154822 RepID=UPI003445BB7B
ALLPCAGPHAITRSGTLFDQTSPVIDKRMASKRVLQTSLAYLPLIFTGWGRRTGRWIAGSAYAEPESLTPA